MREQNVLLVNGSPHKDGCTHAMLAEVANTLESEGISADIHWIGNKPIAGCIDCGGCAREGLCIVDDDVNEFRSKAEKYDGFVFGTPCTTRP